MSRFYLSDYILSFTLPRLPYVEGHYVYAWRDGWRTFYIGMGTNRRAWNEHLPLPENRRRATPNFNVLILEHRLTKPQAHLAERYFLAKYTREGYLLLNNRIPNKL